MDSNIIVLLCFVPLVFIILVVALDSVGERKDDCASKAEEPFKKEENKSPDPSSLVSVDRSWKKEEEPVLCGEEWAKKRKARKIDFKYVEGLHEKKLPPSKKPSGELVNRLDELPWVNEFRNIWGEGLGWGGAKSATRKKRWKKALSFNNHEYSDSNYGCLLELNINPTNIIPHTYIPPLWSMGHPDKFEANERGDQKAFEIARSWEKENARAMNSLLGDIFSDLPIAFGCLISNLFSARGFRLYLAIKMAKPDTAILSVKKKWVSQEKLFHLILEVYPDAIAEYSPDWLENQRIDVFIPQLNIAFEYQGQQHYEPIDFFGGEEAYKKTVDRDLRKQHLCEENDVKLIYWKYSEEITKSALNKKIQAASLR
ncbi:hypothetical protein N8544_00695 [Akkermansiaceae bacterium]|nr:hypothetical protein [Akkermansiaceae bacterium]